MRIFVVAGEKSGDFLGQQLLSELKKRVPHLELKGIAGPLLREVGVECTLAMEELQIMGFSQVLFNLPKLLGILDQTANDIERWVPDVLLLIDYQEFNMRLAKMVRRKGFKGKIVQYVAPSVWAWRKNRAGQLAKTHDLLLAILPFEPPLFEKVGLSCHYVGHPLFETMPHAAYPTEELLGLFPGSRVHEIEHNLPIMLEVTKQMGIPIEISCASEKVRPYIEKELSKQGLNVPLIPFEKRHELMQRSTLALATSGTVTLELALMEVPSVAMYKLTQFNYLCARYLFRILLPHYCLPNIIANDELFPEFYHKQLDSKDIVHALTKIQNQRKECIAKLQKLKSSLGNHRASVDASDRIMKLLERI